MVDLELKRTAEDRQLYALEGVGTLRLEGLGRRMATAEAGSDSWHITRRGFWRQTIEATDAADTVVAEFKPRGLRRGGALRWGTASSSCAQRAAGASATPWPTATMSLPCSTERVGDAGRWR